MSNTTMTIGILILEELARLNADTNYDPYAGLMVEYTGGKQVKIFDDYASGIGSEADMLASLHKLKPIDWAKTRIGKEDPFEYIWQALVKAGLSY